LRSSPRGDVASGVLIDSRGAARCYDLTGQIGDLLELGYP
jgi:hypothetical protein